jgi:hypothetical protein
MEPKYRSEIETLDELDSDKIYGYNPGLDIASHSILYPELSEFNESKKLWEDRGDSKKKVGCTKDNKEWHCLDSPNLYKSPVITKVSTFLRKSVECR